MSCGSENLSTDIAAAISLASPQARFQTGIAYNTLGALFNQGSTFAVNILVANFLGKQIFGRYAMVQSTLSSICIVAQLAAAYTATKYLAEYRSTDPARAGRILGTLFLFSVCLAGIAAIALFSFGPWLSRSALRAPEIGPALAIGAWVVFFTTLYGFLMGALSGLESYRTLAIALVWSGLVYMATCAAGARWGGLRGAIAGQAVSALVQFVLLWLAVNKECARQKIKIYFGRTTQEWPIVFKFMLPAALMGFTMVPALWLANAFLVRQHDGYSQMALYSASFSFLTATLFLPNMANYVGMSLINHHKGVGNHLGYRRTFWMNLGLSATIAILGAGGLALFGRDLLRIFGKDFREGYPVLLILLLAIVAQGIGMAAYQVIQSQTKMWLSFFAIAIPRDVLIVGLAYLLIPTHGAKGLAAAYTIAWTVAALVIGAIVYHIGLHSDSRLELATQ